MIVSVSWVTTEGSKVAAEMADSLVEATAGTQPAVAAASMALAELTANPEVSADPELTADVELTAIVGSTAGAESRTSGTRWAGTMPAADTRFATVMASVEVAVARCSGTRQVHDVPEDTEAGGIKPRVMTLAP